MRFTLNLKILEALQYYSSSNKTSLTLTLDLEFQFPICHNLLTKSEEPMQKPSENLISLDLHNSNSLQGSLPPLF